MNQRPLAKSEVFDVQVEPSVLADADDDIVLRLPNDFSNVQLLVCTKDCDLHAKRRSILQGIEGVLESYELRKQSETPLGNDVLLVFTSSKGIHAVVRTHVAGVITFTIEEPHTDKCLFGEREIDELLSELRKMVDNILKVVKLFYIKRGLPIDVYAMTTDRRIVEYDFDKLLFEDKSRYQHIRLVHSPSFGNMLWLDNLQNLAEEDAIYTHCLMNKSEENYKDKTVLILGGGDGALLYELLKQNPKFVTMVDNEMVMDQCKIHLRSACGDVLDNYKGDNYQIIVDDALKIMAEYVKEGKKFDFIFNDLTDVPVTVDPVSIYWTLIEKILNLALPLLDEHSKYYNHATNYNAISSLKMYEQLLDSLNPKVTYRKYDAHVPSFMERWVFYEMKKLH